MPAMFCPSIRLVNSLSHLKTCVDSLSSKRVKSLAIDVEGARLSCTDRLSTIRIQADHAKTTWVVDVNTLQRAACNHPAPGGNRSLKSALENPVTEKLCFDVRMDANALFNLYGVHLNNVYDLQLLDVAVKRSQGKCVPAFKGQLPCIEEHLGVQNEWRTAKEKELKSIRKEIGDKNKVDLDIFAYSAQDVGLLFELRSAMESKVSNKMDSWKERVMNASAARVAMAHHGPFEGNGKHWAVAPKF